MIAVRVSGVFEPGRGVRVSVNAVGAEAVSRVDGTTEQLVRELAENFSAALGPMQPGSHRALVSSQRDEVRIFAPFGDSPDWQPRVCAEADAPFVVEVVEPEAREPAAARRQPPRAGFG